jgi:predicted nuclease of predicted toxin-antitoxin system
VPAGRGLPSFLTDENIPDSVGDWLMGEGYTLYRARDLVVPGTADVALGAIASAEGAILVTRDKDFRRIADRLGMPRAHVRLRMHCIILTGQAPLVRDRLEDLLEAVLFELDQCATRNLNLYMEIRDHAWRSER